MHEEEKPNKKTIVRIRREFEDEGHGDPFDKASQSKEQPLDKLTDDKLEEVEKLKTWEAWLAIRQLPLWEKITLKVKARKIWHDGTITPENIRAAFESETGKENKDAIRSKVDAKDGKSQAARWYADHMHGGKGKGGDKKITRGLDKKVKEMVERYKRENFTKLPEGGHAPDNTSNELTPDLVRRMMKERQEKKKVSMGDPSKSNQHEGNNDPFGQPVDDGQIYIGKPAKQGKRNEPENTE